ncbi:hypothetical protein BX666DRAFT_1947805 [Dichotomocladium elegans]|nr:hypothetical protein BX666DRAFT_1947805 [Dichotomocladium elegans]
MLNLRHILLSLRVNGEIPERFRHAKSCINNAKADSLNPPKEISGHVIARDIWINELLRRLVFVFRDMTSS